MENSTMKEFVTDKYGCVWRRSGGVAAYRRVCDKFRISDLSEYNHSIHSVEARGNVKKLRNRDRTIKNEMW